MRLSILPLVSLALLLGCGGYPVGNTCEETFHCASGQSCYAQVDTEVAFPGGFCSRSCDVEGEVNQCPSDSVCTRTGTRLLCAPTCKEAADCREGYTCQPVANRADTQSCAFVP
jgi:hypothetical protein